MTTPFPFVAGAVLQAQQLNDITNLPINDQTASYVLVVGDAGKRVIMNNAGATTITVNNSVFGVGDTIFIANKGAGTTTITAGAGVTINTASSLALTQHGGGTLVALSASSFTFFSGGPKTLSVDVFMVGGGGSGATDQSGDQGGGGGGGGGVKTVTSASLIAGTYTVLIGAAGSAPNLGIRSIGNAGGDTYFGNFAASGGGGGNTATSGSVTQGGSGGGGGGNSTSAGTGISGQGNNGGTGNAQTNAGGGGGAGGTGGNGSGTTGGSGGAGTTNDWTGTTITVGSGGGGMGSVTGGTGGTNAGNGGKSATAATSASPANRGCGGGGAYATNGAGAGSSGIVRIRLLTSDATKFSISTTGSPATGTNGSYTYYEWTSSGSFILT